MPGLPWVWGFPWGFPWVWVWGGYGDYDESPWVCGDSMGIFESRYYKKLQITKDEM